MSALAPRSLENVDRALREALAGREPRREDVPGFRSAAVLVPVVPRRGEPHLLFTLRSADLPTHSGQVSFPGGKVEESDADHVAAALREAEEEVGLAPAHVEVLGFLDDVVTPTGFVIRPVVGLVAESAVFGPSAEVAEAFEISFAALAEPGVYKDMGDVERAGRIYRFVAFEVDGRNIWGATARVVHQLLLMVGALGGYELADE